MNAVMLTLAVVGGLETQLHPRQFMIDVCLCQGDPLGSRAEGTLKILAEPRLVCFDGQPARFMAGGSLPLLRGGKIEYRPVGIQLKNTATHQADGRVQLDLELSLSQRDPQTGGIRTEARELSRVVKPGEKIRVRVAAASAELQTWAEVTVTEVTRAK